MYQSAKRLADLDTTLDTIVKVFGDFEYQLPLDRAGRILTVRIDHRYKPSDIDMFLSPVSLFRSILTALNEQKARGSDLKDATPLTEWGFCKECENDIWQRNAPHNTPDGLVWHDKCYEKVFNPQKDTITT